MPLDFRISKILVYYLGYKLTMIKVKVISDTICPWCYIGKRNFDLALKQVPDIKVSFEYSTFQLDPNMPPEGIDRSDYVSKKFDKEQYINIKNNIKNEAI